MPTQNERRNAVTSRVLRAALITAIALPISGAGKVMKYKLREPHWAGHDRRVG